LTIEAGVVILKTMLDHSRSGELDAVFHALAHPVRREILRQVATEERTISQLAEPFAMTLEAVSQHVRVLERARLVRRVRTGRVHRCRMDPKPLRQAGDLIARLTRHWSRQLDALDRWLRETGGEP
jgi:DNA-binding transcriptional ArsR family regulator